MVIKIYVMNFVSVTVYIHELGHDSRSMRSLFPCVIQNLSIFFVIIVLVVTYKWTTWNISYKSHTSLLKRDRPQSDFQTCSINLKYYKQIIHLNVILSPLTFTSTLSNNFSFKIFYTFLVLPIITTFLIHPWRQASPPCFLIRFLPLCNKNTILKTYVICEITVSKCYYLWAE